VNEAITSLGGPFGDLSWAGATANIISARAKDATKFLDFMNFLREVTIREESISNANKPTNER
jgi:hypothetical protein